MLQALWSQDPPAHHPSPGCGCPPFRHRSVVRMHTIFSLLASSTMPPPPPQHKELFSLRQPDWIHEISHWGGEANPRPTWPTCQDSTRITEVAEWRRADTRGRRAKRALPCCPSAFSPSQPFKWPRSIYYILIPLLGPGTHWGQDRWIPFTEYPFCQWQAKKEKKKSANKQDLQIILGKQAQAERSTTHSSRGLTIGSLNSQHQQHLRYYWKWKFLGPTPDQLIWTLRGHAVCFLQATRCMPKFQKL